MKEILIIGLLSVSLNLFAKNSSKQKINNHLFSRFIEKVESNYLKNLRVEKDSKKRLIIEKEMSVIKLAQRSKTIWNSLSLDDQEKVIADFKTKIRSKSSSASKTVAKLFDVAVKEKQVVYSINLLVGLMRNVQNENIYNHSLISQLELREHKFFKKNKKELKNFAIYIGKNLTKDHQLKVINLYKNFKSKKEKIDLQNRVIGLYQGSQSSTK